MSKSFLKFIKSTRTKIRRYFGVTFDGRKVLIFGGVFIVVFSLVLIFGFGVFQNKKDFYVSPTFFDYGKMDGDVFLDVPNNHPNAYALAYLKSFGIIKGYDDDTFKPDESMNRAAFMKMLSGVFRMHPHKLHYNNCYSDVQDQWFAPYVCLAKSQGWIEDFETFRPDENITRADALKIFMTAFEIEPFNLAMSSIQPDMETLQLKYSDVEFEDWYVPYLLVAESNKWFVGMQNSGRFGADDEITRGEVGELMFRVIVTTIPVY